MFYKRLTYFYLSIYYNYACKEREREREKCVCAERIYYIINRTRRVAYYKNPRKKICSLKNALFHLPQVTTKQH